MTILSYQEAKEYIISFTANPKTKYGYYAWRTVLSINNLPEKPDQYYTYEWQGWNDFLSSDLMPIDKAIDCILSLNIKRKDLYLEELEYGCLNSLPANFPRYPMLYYRDEWFSIGGWTGFLTGKLPVNNQFSWKPFDEMTNFVINDMGITNKKQYRKLISDGRLPRDIPKNLGDNTYSDYWISWDDFFGEKSIPYEDFKAIMDCLNITSILDYKKWYKANNPPASIPENPPVSYNDHGWEGWADAIGCVKRWSKTEVMDFIKSLQPIIETLSEAELYSILSTNGMLVSITKKYGIKKIPNALKDIYKGTFDMEGELTEDQDEFLIHETTIDDILEEEEASKQSLPSLTIKSILNKTDILEFTSSDDELIEFIVNNGVRAIWNEVLEAKDQADIENIIDILDNHACTAYSVKLKEMFMEQYTGTINIPIPQGYSFKKNNIPYQPNLMQRLVAYQMVTKKKLLNLSSTGAGKSLSAILSSRVINAKFTVIITLNNTLYSWADEINNAFPDSNIIVKQTGKFSPSTHKPNYLILNYESFQRYSATQLVNYLLANHHIDMIVLDEIQRAKHDNLSDQSTRRKVITKLVSTAVGNNPECRVLGASATPIINCLAEGVSLLELVTCQKYDDLEVSPTINHALKLHQQLVINSIRYKPKYETMHVNELTLEIPTADINLANDLLALTKLEPLKIDQLLLPHKLETIANECQSGTVIYTQFVNGIFDTLEQYLISKGFTVGIFNGTNKSGLSKFLDHEVDILIGSPSISTGIDGLQSRCDKVIIASLPWTSSDYEQLIGRVYRQGSNFNNIDIVIPQVVLYNGNSSWSWDKQRLAKIHYKKTLADAAVDGCIPLGVLMSKNTLMTQSLKALQQWMNRIDSNQIQTIEREPIEEPILPEPTLPNTPSSFRVTSQFSKMNGRISCSLSSTTHERMKKDPSEFHNYHTLYREIRNSWCEIPYKVIANKLMNTSNLIIGDFGCGEALLSKMLPQHTVLSIDHVAIDDTVLVQDIAHTQLPDNSLDVVVFSLSLMGTNWRDYLKEANRVLKQPGYLRIAEPANKWKDEKIDKLRNAIVEVGFDTVGEPILSKCGNFIYINASIDPF